MSHKEVTSCRDGISRRSLMKAGVAGLVTGVAGAVPFARSALAAEPIKIGVLLAKSGTYAVQGTQGYNGATIAVADANSQVLGRPIELVWLDENGPQTTQQNMQRLIQQEKVVAVQGGISSGDILAIMPVAEREKILLMATGPNASEITGEKCARYTFRVDSPNYETTRSVYPTFAKNGKNWYFLYASYAWGIDGFQQMSKLLKDDGGKVVGADQTPLGTTDYSSFILKIVSAKPDAIYLGLGGSDLTNFLKQFHQMGLTGKIPVSALSCNDTDLWSAGPAAATGVYPKIWNYTGDQNTELSRAFVKSYMARYKTPPEAEAWQDWFGTTAIITAIKETGSTDSSKLVEFLEGHKFDGYKKAGSMYFRPWDHQLIQPTLVAQVKKKVTDKYDYFDIVEEVPGKGQTFDDLFGSQAESLCKMPTSL
ncbi:ABC transporter substrate-binding protein [Bordetella petrii]|uniref:ABC transporter substrate-binding protein n=1 Tax=Bordetella petrii TaxID=94624 RepID=UPI001A962F67|nr:ABC transporter substrate-binding protein [Bordetella petrii]MBO1110620.1 ABC transporter substrate-binding protein [Bordetella petrii]